MNSLSIVHISEPACGGVRKHLCLLIPAQLKLGYKVHLIVSSLSMEAGFGNDMLNLQKLGAQISVLPIRKMPSPKSDYSNLIKIRNLLKMLNPQIIHTHCAKAGLLGRLAARKLDGCKLFHSPHSFFFSAYKKGIKKNLSIKLERNLAKKTHQYILLSEGEKKIALAAKICEESQISLIENSLPADYANHLFEKKIAREKLLIPQNEFVFAVLARLTLQKGQDRLILAVKKLKEKNPNFCMYLFGDGDLAEELQKQILDNHLENHLKIFGFIEKISLYLRAFDCTLLPSRYEGLSYSLLESIAAGIPIVTSCIEENLPTKDFGGFIQQVDVDNAEDFSNFLNTMMNHFSDYIQYAKKAQELLQKDFSLDQQVQKLDEVYRQAVS